MSPDPESIRLARTIESLPSRERVIVRRLMIRMLNPPTAPIGVTAKGKAAEPTPEAEDAGGLTDKVSA